MRISCATKNKSLITYLLMALYSSAAFYLSLEHIYTTGYAFERVFYNIFDSIQSFTVEQGLVIALLAFFYKFSDERLTGEYSARQLFIPSFILAFFMVFGESFYKTDTWFLALDLRDGQMVKAIIKYTAYMLLFSYVLRWIYHFLDSAKSDAVSNSWYMRMLREHTGLTVAVTMLVSYIPELVLSFPAQLSTDTIAEIMSTYPALGVYELSTHHPIVHTLLLGGCTELGVILFNSATWGIFLYAVLQLAIIVLSVCYAMKVIVHETEISDLAKLLAMLYFALNVRIRTSVSNTTKDVIYSAMVLVFIAALYQMCRGKTKGKPLAVYIISAIGVLLFRNEGKYVLLISFVLLAILRKEHRKLFASSAIGILALSVLVTNIIIPAAGVKKGSIREMLCVPFQQTARYVKECGDAVTEEEAQAISAVLDYENLPELYTPYFADPVKDTFNENASRQDLINYFKAWAKMLVKHPTVYIQATMSNYYTFFYPENSGLSFGSFTLSDKAVSNLNQHLETIQRSVSVPDWIKDPREYYRFATEKLAQIPGINILLVPATYSWVLLILLCHGLTKKKYDTLIILFPIIMTLLIACMGPCNGELCRYSMPRIFSLPILLAAYMDIMRRGKINAQN